VSDRPLSSRALFVVVYTTSVSSVYFALGVIAHRADGLTPAVLLVAGVFFLLAAMTYAEGAAMHPDERGRSRSTTRS
jgi:APA family basic amino acid/polyamine antiporter